MTDQSRVEAVLMEQIHGYSVCVSIPSRLVYGCVFCASTQGGLYRDLTAAEIIGQVDILGSYSKSKFTCCRYGRR